MEGCYEPVYCPAETIGELHFEATLGGTTAMFMCHQSSMSYGRVCKENGEWESVMGYCLCPAEKDEFNTECSKSCKMEGLFFPAKERL